MVRDDVLSLLDAVDNMGSEAIEQEKRVRLAEAERADETDALCEQAAGSVTVRRDPLFDVYAQVQVGIGANLGLLKQMHGGIEDDLVYISRQVGDIIERSLLEGQPDLEEQVATFRHAHLRDSLDRIVSALRMGMRLPESALARLEAAIVDHADDLRVAETTQRNGRFAEYVWAPALNHRPDGGRFFLSPEQVAVLEATSTKELGEPRYATITLNKRTRRMKEEFPTKSQLAKANRRAAAEEAKAASFNEGVRKAFGGKKRNARW